MDFFFFFAVPTFILNALPARGKEFWGALVDKNVQWGRHQCRDLDTLGCQPGGQVWLWALFSLCSESRNESKSCCRAFGTPQHSGEVPFVLPRARQSQKVQVFSTRPSHGPVGDPPRELCLHLPLPTAPWTRSMFSAETLAFLAGRYKFLCLVQNNFYSVV